MCNVKGRDIGSFVHDAQQAVALQVKMPPGYFVTWGGQFENLQRASNRLLIVVPLALFLIFVLLFSTFSSVKQALLIYTGIPFAVVGGILALALGHEFRPAHPDGTVHQAPEDPGSGAGGRQEDSSAPA